MTRVQIFENLVKKAADTYKAKNADYGDSFVKVRQKYSNSVLIRLNDKLSRLETLMDKSKDAQIKDESIDDTLLDLANYALMELTERIYEHSTMNINDSDCNNIADETVDEKLTPEDIIKALPNMTYGGHYCAKCKYDNGKGNDRCGLKGCKIARYALDLITCQQAEYENLKVENQSLRTAGNSLKMHYEEAQAEIESLKIFRGYAEKRASDYKTMRDKYLNAKTEAYKEFAERVKEFMHNKFKALDEYEFEYITERDIDNLVKEMVDENNSDE